MLKRMMAWVALAGLTSFGGLAYSSAPVGADGDRDLEQGVDLAMERVRAISRLAAGAAGGLEGLVAGAGQSKGAPGMGGPVQGAGGLLGQLELPAGGVTSMPGTVEQANLLREVQLKGAQAEEGGAVAAPVRRGNQSVRISVARPDGGEQVLWSEGQGARQGGTR